MFHWKPERMKAHVAIACMRRWTYRTALQQKTRISPETIGRWSPMLNHVQHKFETALCDPFEDDARHGPHLPDSGSPAVPNALLH